MVRIYDKTRFDKNWPVLLYSNESRLSNIRGSSNKEWDFFYGAVTLHAKLMKYHTYLVCPFGSSRATFLS